LFYWTVLRRAAGPVTILVVVPATGWLGALYRQQQNLPAFAPLPYSTKNVPFSVVMESGAVSPFGAAANLFKPLIETMLDPPRMRVNEREVTPHTRRVYDARELNYFPQ
jgi:hypothetical protein